MINDNEEKSVREIKNMFEAMQAVNKEETKNNTDGLMSERVDDALLKMQDGVEKLRSEGENIVSRYRSGVIGRDVARSRMRDLLSRKCEELLGLTMYARGINPNMEVTEDQIRAALGEVKAKLS